MKTGTYMIYLYISLYPPTLQKKNGNTGNNGNNPKICIYCKGFFVPVFVFPFFELKKVGTKREQIKKGAFAPLFFS